MPENLRPLLWLTCWLLAFSPTGRAQSGPDALLGHWVMQDGSALLAVEPDTTGYRVRILSILEREFVPADGELHGQRRDIRNPRPDLRDRSLEDLTLAHLDYAEDGWEGEIYDPGSGNTYRCRVSVQGDYLRVRGFVGVSLLGRTVYWQRSDHYAEKVLRMLNVAESAASPGTLNQARATATPR